MEINPTSYRRTKKKFPAHIHKTNTGLQRCETTTAGLRGCARSTFTWNLPSLLGREKDRKREREKGTKGRESL